MRSKVNRGSCTTNRVFWQMGTKKDWKLVLVGMFARHDHFPITIFPSIQRPCHGWGLLPIITRKLIEKDMLLFVLPFLRHPPCTRKWAGLQTARCSLDLKVHILLTDWFLSLWSRAPLNSLRRKNHLGSQFSETFKEMSPIPTSQPSE